MESLAARYPDVAFVFVYVREAHPGERVRAHQSLGDKSRAAEEFRLRWQVTRPIVVDDLAGTLHKAYGCLPNMAYIVERGGRIAYRADWTDVASVGTALDYIAAKPGARGGTRRVAAFYSETLGYRSADGYPGVFLEGLAGGGGERAVEEFIAASERRSPTLGRRMREQWARRKGMTAP